MFFEGRCHVSTFPAKIRDAVLSPDLSMTTPEPLWEDISSNLGSTANDNGHVFKARFSESQMVWGIKRGFPTSWWIGQEIFVATKYTPGVAGTNGTFTDYIMDSMPYYFNAGGYTPETLPVRYWISVKKERVIIAYRADVLNTDAKVNVLYFGRPLVSFDPFDKGFVLGNALSWYFNQQAKLRQLGYANSNTGYMEMNVYSDAVPMNKTWGGHVFPSPLKLHTSGPTGNQGGFRGILDMMILIQDGRLRQVDNVNIGGVDYLGFEVPHQQTITQTYNWYANNFSTPSRKVLLLFPKD